MIYESTAFRLGSSATDRITIEARVPNLHDDPMHCTGLRPMLVWDRGNSRSGTEVHWILCEDDLLTSLRIVKNFAQRKES